MTIGRSPIGEYWRGLLDDVRIYDSVLPAGEIANLHGAGGGASGYYLDEFPDFSCDGADEYAGSSGTLDWSASPWVEVGDDGRACGANFRVLDDPALPDSSGNRLRLQNKNRAVYRQLDLSGYTSATLSFDYRRDGANALGVMVSADGGSSWNVLGKIVPGTDAAYQSASYDLTPYIAANTQIEFLVDGSFSGEVYIDNVRIDLNSGGGGGSEPPPADGVVFEEFTQASLASDGKSMNVDKPGGTAAGDLLIAVMVTDGEQKNEMTQSDGWTLIDHGVESKQVSMDVWWQLAGSSEPAQYAFGWAKSQEAYGWIMRFTGHDPGNPINSSANDDGKSAAPTSPSVNTTVANAMILRIGGFDDDDITDGVPGLSGHTAITMDKSGFGNGTASGGAGYTIQASAGSSSTSSFSLSATEEYRTVTIAITPAL